MGIFNFNQPKSEGHNRSQFHQKSLAPIPCSASSPVPKFKNNNRDKAPGSNSQVSVSNACTNPLCQKYGRHHEGECRGGSDVCFGCGKSGFHIRKCRVILRKVGMRVNRASPISH